VHVGRHPVFGRGDNLTIAVPVTFLRQPADIKVPMPAARR
jgi:hypothetical protein